MEIIVIGHLSRDLIVSPDHSREAIGGGTAYAMLAPSIGALGAGIISRIGTDFEQEYIDALKMSGLDLTGLRTSDGPSTRFVNTYDAQGDRIQRVEALAPKIRVTDFLPQHMNANIYHFCPLTNDEIDLACIEAAKTAGGLVSLDVQGLLRNVKNKAVVYTDWADRDEYLKYTDVVKMEARELALAFPDSTELSAATHIINQGPKIVVITRDRLGSTIYTRSTQVDIPIVLAEKFVDSTGCGDTYIIGFLLEYMRTGDVKRAGLFGATCASFNLESIGPYEMPSREQVEHRMKDYL